MTVVEHTVIFSPHPSIFQTLAILKNCSKSTTYRCEVACCGQLKTESNLQLNVKFFRDWEDLLSLDRSFSSPHCDWNKENGKFKCLTAVNSPCKRRNHTCVVTQGRASYSLNFTLPRKSILCAYANYKHNHDVPNVSMQLFIMMDLT